jgi:Sec-independent protein translocase protein TatA
VLGPKRLPEVARTLGRGFRDFRDAISGEGHPTANELQEQSIPPEPEPEPAAATRGSAQRPLAEPEPQPPPPPEPVTSQASRDPVEGTG